MGGPRSQRTLAVMLSMPWRTLSPSRRAQLRAAIIAYFAFLNVLAALPTLGTPSAERLERPFEQQELRRWARLFAALGVEAQPEWLAHVYLRIASSLAEVRAVALEPIEGWMSLTQTEQSWRLFGSPDEYCSVLRISAYSAVADAGAARGGALDATEREEVLYESGNPERRWNAALLEYRRVRAAYNPTRSGPPATYAGLGQRLSEQIFRSLPLATRVRIVLDRSRIGLPGEAPDPTHEEQYVLEFSRPG
jgi:hypothetical protein